MVGMLVAFGPESADDRRAHTARPTRTLRDRGAHHLGLCFMPAPISPPIDREA